MMPETDPVIRRIVYPARVHLPDGTDVRLAKLAITVEGVYVFAGTPTGIGLVFVAAYSAATLPATYQPRSDPYLFETPEGQVRAYRLPGCGCGAATLKHYRPFPATAERIGT